MCRKKQLPKEERCEKGGIRDTIEGDANIKSSQKESYKYKRVEQSDGIKSKLVYETVKRKMKLWRQLELNDKNLIHTINKKSPQLQPTH